MPRFPGRAPRWRPWQTLSPRKAAAAAEKKKNPDRRQPVRKNLMLQLEGHTGSFALARSGNDVLVLKLHDVKNSALVQLFHLLS